MGVRLSEDEMWEFLASGHTGIFTTLRSDGHPVPLPVWYVVLDGAVYVQSPERTKKVARVRRDERASFLVESGEAWVELKAVMMTGRVSLVDDEDVRERVAEAMTEKYASFRPDRGNLPDATRKHYSSGRAVIRFEPTGPPITWDNSKIRLTH